VFSHVSHNFSPGKNWWVLHKHVLCKKEFVKFDSFPLFLGFLAKVRMCSARKLLNFLPFFLISKLPGNFYLLSKYFSFLASFLIWASRSCRTDNLQNTFVGCFCHSFLDWLDRKDRGKKVIFSCGYSGPARQALRLAMILYSCRVLNSGPFKG